MTSTAFGFFMLGLSLGACVGLVTFALLYTAKRSDEDQEP